MSSIASIRASNKSVLSSLSTPTAVFVGGTSGIGRAMAERFAQHTDGQANIVIVGRNEQAAKEIISSFPPPQPPLKHEFIACDVTSMKAAGEAAARIRSTFPTIDFLVLTPGYASMDGREETSEGLDKKMAVNYYGRWKFVYDLADKLNPERGGKVLTVLGAGHGAKVDIDDLPIRNGYSVSKVAVVTPTYNDLAMESFAKLYPKHSFIHAFPGVVRTPYLANSKTHLIRWTAPVVMGLSYPFSFSSEENAEYMWHGMLAAKAGALRMGSKGEDIGKKNYFGSEEERETLWNHTVEAVNGK